jgi:hypothetical protein
MFNGMLCPIHQNPLDRIVDTDFRVLVEEHPEDSFENLADMGTDNSIIELMISRVMRWFNA